MIVHMMDQPAMEYGAGPIGTIVAPTRELAHQIYVEARKYSRTYGVVTCAVYGGMNKHEQWKALKAGCDVIVCTPVRLSLRCVSYKT
jgi:ATP-dependent RNA helicase DDX42